MAEDVAEPPFLQVDLAPQWMQRAFEEAEKAYSLSEVPVGAVFVAHPKAPQGSAHIFDASQGNVVARGHNLTNKSRNVRCCLPTSHRG